MYHRHHHRFSPISFSPPQGLFTKDVIIGSLLDKAIIPSPFAPNGTFTIYYKHVDNWCTWQTLRVPWIEDAIYDQLSPKEEYNEVYAIFHT